MRPCMILIILGANSVVREEVAGTRAPDRDGEEAVDGRWGSRWDCATICSGRYNREFRPFHAAQGAEPMVRNDRRKPQAWFPECPALGQVEGHEVKFVLYRGLDAGGCHHGLPCFLPPSVVAEGDSETDQTGWDAPKIPPRDRNVPSPGLAGWPRRVKFRVIRDSTGFEPVSGIRSGAVPRGCRRQSSDRRPPRVVQRRSTVGRSRAPQSGPGRLLPTGCT